MSNIKSFIEGNFNYYIHKIGWYPAYKAEQILYRMEQCKNDCIPSGECIICNCPTEKKMFATKSCNEERFPDIMNEKDWNKFKIQEGIE